MTGEVHDVVPAAVVLAQPLLQAVEAAALLDDELDPRAPGGVENPLLLGFVAQHGFDMERRRGHEQHPQRTVGALPRLAVRTDLADRGDRPRDVGARKSRRVCEQLPRQVAQALLDIDAQRQAAATQGLHGRGQPTLAGPVEPVE